MPGRLARDFFSFHGRIRRRTYWLRSLTAGAVVGLVATFATVIRPYAPLAFWPLMIAAVALGAAIWASLVVRRYHDHGRKGARGVAAITVALLVGGFGQDFGAPFPAMVLASVGGLALSIYLGFVRGVRGPNVFGPDPVED